MSAGVGESDQRGVNHVLVGGVEAVAGKQRVRYVGLAWHRTLPRAAASGGGPIGLAEPRPLRTDKRLGVAGRDGRHEDAEGGANGHAEHPLDGAEVVLAVAVGEREPLERDSGLVELRVEADRPKERLGGGGDLPEAVGEVGPRRGFNFAHADGLAE